MGCEADGTCGDWYGLFRCIPGKLWKEARRLLVLKVSFLERCESEDVEVTAL